MSWVKATRFISSITIDTGEDVSASILHPRARRKLGCHEVELLGLSTCDWNSQHRVPHSALSPGQPHVLTGSPVCCKAMWRQCRTPRECCVLDGEFSQPSLGQAEVDTNNAERQRQHCHLCQRATDDTNVARDTHVFHRSAQEHGKVPNRKRRM
jgi:hypothetical protein